MTTRERNLWIGAGLVLVGIYSTMGVAQSIAGWLRGIGVLEAVSTTAVLLLLATFLVRRRGTRLSRREIGLVVGVGFTYFWAAMRVMSPEERTHLLEYGIVATFLHAALEERSRSMCVPLPAARLAWLIAVALGVIDELVQWVLPSRVFDWRDIGFNAFATTSVIVVRVLMAQWRRRKAGGR